ncbi:MAG: FkbM family methyltransferase [Verrucomicrobiia bacterium]
MGDTVRNKSRLTRGTLVIDFRGSVKRCCQILAGSKRVRREVRAISAFARIVQTREVFSQCGIDLVVDVGANIGQFAQELRAFYKGEIVSFEPVSTAFGELARHASGDPHWRCYPWALGSQTESRVIHVCRLTHLSSLLKANEYAPRRFGGAAAETGQEMVSVRRLDEVLDEIAPDYRARRMFLKADTQGFDAEVFKGLGTKVEYIAALQSEVSVIPIYEGMPHWMESIALYERAGFGVVGLFPVSFDSSRVIEFDCLMVRT